MQSLINGFVNANESATDSPLKIKNIKSVVRVWSGIIFDQPCEWLAMHSCRFDEKIIAAVIGYVVVVCASTVVSEREIVQPKSEYQHPA